VAYRAACNADLKRSWNDTDHGGRLACDYVLAALDSTSPAMCPSPARADDEGIGFETILTDPAGQFDLRGDLLASIEAWTNAPSTTMSALPADDEGTGTGAAPSEGHSEAQGEQVRHATRTETRTVCNKCGQQ
jgi:hypothetical protein